MHDQHVIVTGITHKKKLRNNASESVTGKQPKNQWNSLSIYNGKSTVR